MRAITYYQHNAATGECKLSLDFRARRPQWKAMRVGMLAANHLPPPDETSSSNPEGDNVHPCCSIQLLPLRMSAGATSGNAGEDIAFGQEMPKPLVPKGFGNACQRPQDVS
jgi:hypothetical protein